MSRIYEALRRAELERKALGEQPLTMVTPPEEAKLADSAPAVMDLMIEDVIKRTWTPCLDAIPALLDRHEVVEQFRGLRSHLAQARVDAPLKTVLISSGIASEGKSFVALNLAASVARGSRNRVLLIDGDLRRPTLHHWLGASNKPGLSEYLDRTAEQSEILQRNDAKNNEKTLLSGLANLAFIAAGACADNSSELIISSRLESLIASVSQHFDWIFIDSPPILSVPDAVDLARVADGVLLVIRDAKTPYQAIQRAQAAFRQSRLLGVVLNAAKGAHRNSTYYRSYYGGTDQGQESERNKKVRS
jgi:capsular exopolysaccharide synthesis family protein